MIGYKAWHCRLWLLTKRSEWLGLLTKKFQKYVEGLMFLPLVMLIRLFGAEFAGFEGGCVSSERAYKFGAFVCFKAFGCLNRINWMVHDWSEIEHKTSEQGVLYSSSEKVAFWLYTKGHICGSHVSIPRSLTQFSLLSYISLSDPCSPLVKFSLFFLFSSKKFWIPLLFFAILSLTHG